MFTASHNPKEYNGFKFYNNTGCQINDSAVAEISAEMSKIEYFSVPMGDLNGCLEEEKIEYMTDKIKRDYLDAVWEISPLPAKDVKVMYSPLNGHGLAYGSAYFGAGGSQGSQNRYGSILPQ